MSQLNIEETNTHQIIDKQQLSPQAKMIRVHAPEIADKAKAGQFVMLRVDEEGERIPLTLADWENQTGTITLVFQEVGLSTKKLGCLQVRDEIANLAGPLGRASTIKNYGRAAIVCGGVGTAAAYPIAKALKEAGKKVVYVNCSGSAIALFPETETCDAILQAWYGGESGGQAVADVLFGDYNPSGKLPITFYRDSQQLPDFEDYSMAGRTYRYMSDPLFPFGYGLNY